MFKQLILLASIAYVQAADITGCHFHGATQFCVDANGAEGYVSPGPTATANAPSSYTDCHTHAAAETYCLAEEGEVLFVVEGEEEEHAASITESHAHSEATSSAPTTVVSSTASSSHAHSEEESSHVHSEAESSHVHSETSSSAASSSQASISQGAAATLEQTGLLGFVVLGLALLG